MTRESRTGVIVVTSYYRGYYTLPDPVIFRCDCWVDILWTTVIIVDINYCKRPAFAQHDIKHKIRKH